MRYYISIFLFLLYSTAHAQQAAVALDKMNVLYLGVPNPATIAVENTACKDVIVEIEGGGKITPEESMPCHYNISPANPGKILVKVFKKKGDSKVLVGTQEFRCKYIPDPIARVGGKVGGYMCLKIFKVQLGVVLGIDGFDFDCRMAVDAYTITIVRNDQPLYEKKCTGARFDEETSRQFDKLQIGDKIIISEIKFHGPDTHIRALNQDVNLTMKECK